MLNSRQKKILRAKAHDLDPVVLIGKSGASNGCIQSIDEVIEVRELIKIKFIEHKGNKQELSDIIAEKTNSEIIGKIGHVIMLFRQNPDKEKQKYKI